jgi:hypothetical protein
MLRIFLSATMALALSAIVPARAQVTALIVTDGMQSVELTSEEIGKMKQEIIETSTPWTEGVAKFSGPTFTDVLNEVGLAGETVTAEARDGNSVAIPRERLTGDGAILATSMNDAPLAAEKAPFWIIFPYDRAPEMNDEQHQSWSVWGVTKLTVR